MNNLALAIRYELNFWLRKKADPRLTKHDFLRFMDQQQRYAEARANTKAQTTYQNRRQNV